MSEPLRAELAAFSADASGLQNPTVLSVGEARGHGFFIDEKSIDGAMKALLGKSLSSYLKHDGAGEDRLGKEIGFLSGLYRDGQKLKAKAFEYFDAFKREAATTYEKLVEMAQKVPDQLGFSPVISYRPVWVMGDGSERPAELGARAPAGAVREIPSARILAVLSADMVKRPAVNLTGFLSENINPPVDDIAKGKTSKSMSEPITFDQAALDAKLSEQKTAITAELTTAHTASLAAKDTEIAGLTAKLAEKDKAIIDAATAHTAALAAKDAELAKVKTDHEAEIHAMKAKLDEAHKNSAAKLGVPPIKYTAKLAEQLNTAEAKLSHWEKMPDGLEKNQFRRANMTELLQAAEAREAKK